jgi:hypothetical protein
MYLPKRKTHLQEDDTMMNLQEILFFRAKAELDAYMDMKKAECYTEEEIERQRERFCSAYQIIEEAELESEYEDWKEKNA